jgi:hypothetical protein
MEIRAMVSSSSTGSPSLMQPSEKLTKTNHTVWYAQVRATLRGAKRVSYLNSDSTLPLTHVPTIGADGKEIKVDEKVHMVPNPEYEDWDAADQQVLSYLLESLSKDILVHVATCTTSAKAWVAIQGVFASQMRASTVNTHLALGTTRKGILSITEYSSKMKDLGDEMAAAERTLEDEELIEYIIAGLDEEYTPLVSAICSRVELISLSDFYWQLLTFETHASLLQDGQTRSAHATSRGGGFRGRGAGCGRGGRRSGGRTSPPARCGSPAGRGPFGGRTSPLG